MDPGSIVALVLVGGFILLMALVQGNSGQQKHLEPEVIDQTVEIVQSRDWFKNIRKYWAKDKRGVIFTFRSQQEYLAGDKVKVKVEVVPYNYHETFLYLKKTYHLDEQGNKKVYYDSDKNERVDEDVYKGIS